jgi:hypothetical protein
MSTNKLLREFERAVEREGVQIIATSKRGGHLHLKLCHADARIQKLTMAGSPTDCENAQVNALQCVRRFARSTIPKEPRCTD